MRVRSISGDGSIDIRTGGSRDPNTSPPTNQAEATDAINIMNAYQANGSRGSWHTPAASIRHERHHEREWHCSNEHYWPQAQAKIDSLTVPIASYSSESDAVAAMKSDADNVMTSFAAAVQSYYMSLCDSAGCRPYCAGQDTLNGATMSVQSLAATNGWTVPTNVTVPGTIEPPCYLPYPPWTP